MRTLVTGATGFIGGRLAEVLLERGDEVRLLVRRPEAAAELRARGATIFEHELGPEPVPAAALEGIEVVFHCAGLSADWGTHEAFQRINVAGARALAEASANTVKRFVHVSTTDVFGYPSSAVNDDAAPLDVGLPYNRSKVQGELAVREVAARTGLALTVIRPATVYGPKSKDFAVELATLLSKGEMVFVNGGRSPAGLIYVDNLVALMISAATRPEAVGRTYTARDPSTESWKTYVDGIADGLGLPRAKWSLPLWLALVLGWCSERLWALLRKTSRPLITRHVAYILGRDQAYGIARSVQELQFQPKIGFDEGLKRTVAWLRGAHATLVRTAKD